MQGYYKKRKVLLSITTFDLVTLVQTLQRPQTTTNSVIVELRFMLLFFAVARHLCTCKWLFLLLGSPRLRIGCGR